MSLNSVRVLRNSASPSSTLSAITLTLEPASFEPAVLVLAEGSPLSVDFPALLDNESLFGNASYHRMSTSPETMLSFDVLTQTDCQDFPPFEFPAVLDTKEEIHGYLQ